MLDLTPPLLDTHFEVGIVEILHKMFEKIWNIFVKLEIIIYFMIYIRVRFYKSFHKMNLLGTKSFMKDFWIFLVKFLIACRRHI